MNRFLLSGAAALALALAPGAALAKRSPETAAPTAAAAQAPSAAPQAPAAAPQAPAAAPATAPTPACETRAATVYFDTNSTALSPESEAALAQTADGPETCAIQSVSVTGFADASGDADYNRALAERRSVAVRDALVREGVPGEAITVAAHGEVAESDDPARDRRVEVQIVMSAAVAQPAAS
ncbi:MAG: OmpA family protein [Hyphomonadaceae bacterium]|nr:OmpA family protein [Hyphomonadaceae bacterium]